MNNTQEQIHFEVNIVLDNDGEANFTYSINGNEVTGGGVVRTETAGIYSLDEATLAKGFYSLAPLSPMLIKKHLALKTLALK